MYTPQQCDALRGRFDERKSWYVAAQARLTQARTTYDGHDAEYKQERIKLAALREAFNQNPRDTNLAQQLGALQSYVGELEAIVNTAQSQVQQARADVEAQRGPATSLAQEYNSNCVGGGLIV
jgi:flagellar biosynthesis chaperone FliJ